MIAWKIRHNNTATLEEGYGLKNVSIKIRRRKKMKKNDYYFDKSKMKK